MKSVFRQRTAVCYTNSLNIRPSRFISPKQLVHVFLRQGRSYPNKKKRLIMYEPLSANQPAWPQWPILLVDHACCDTFKGSQAFLFLFFYKVQCSKCLYINFTTGHAWTKQSVLRRPPAEGWRAKYDSTQKWDLRWSKFADSWGRYHVPNKKAEPSRPEPIMPQKPIFRPHGLI